MAAWRQEYIRSAGPRTTAGRQQSRGREGHQPQERNRRAESHSGPATIKGFRRGRTVPQVHYGHQKSPYSWPGKGTLHEEWIETCQSQGHVKCPPLQAGHLTQPPPTGTFKALSRQMPFYGKTNERTYVIEDWSRVVKGRQPQGRKPEGGVSLGTGHEKRAQTWPNCPASSVWPRKKPLFVSGERHFTQGVDRDASEPGSCQMPPVAGRSFNTSPAYRHLQGLVMSNAFLREDE